MAIGRKRQAPSADTNTATIDIDVTIKSNGTTGNSEAKIRTLTFTGEAPVDTYVPNSDRYEVLSLFNKTYSCTLNQSNTDRNNNKFYLLQILKKKGTEEHFTFYRWGRVGKAGVTNM